MQTPSPYRRAVPPDGVLSHWIAPDGWRLRRFDWQAARPRGRILFQCGRGDFFEKYLETFADLNAAGWSVTTFDWRGQGGSGRLSPDPHVGHADDFGLFVSDLAAFWREWSQAGEGPRVAIGHSMGGHLIHRAMVEGAIDPQAAVLVAPMLGLKSPLGARWGGRLAQIIARRGDPARAAWKTNERPGSIASRQSLLTRDAGRYADELYWHDARPELLLGPPSWAWLAEAFASTAMIEADARVDTLRIPLLMILAAADGLVDSRAAVRVAKRMPQAELLRFGRESAHEILREADPVRGRALAAIEAFLARIA